MQVYKTFYKILRKNLPSIITYFFIFLVISIIFTNSGKSNEAANFQSEKLKICILDRDHSTLSSSFTNYIGSIHKLVTLEDNTELLQENLFYRNVDYILIIQNGFEKKLVAGDTTKLTENIKVPNSYNATFVDNQVDQYIKVLVSYLSTGKSVEEASTLTNTTVTTQTEVTVQQEKASEDNEPIFYYFQYLPYIFICVIMVGLSPILMAFNKTDLHKRIEASALPLKSRNSQLLFASITFMLITFIIFMIPAMILYTNDFFSIIGVFLLLDAFLFIMVAMAISFVISNLVKSANTLNMVGNTIGLGMSFLCGIFVPREFMSASIVNLSKFLPGYWYIDVAETINKYSGSSEQITTIATGLSIQFGFVIALLGIGLVIIKLKRDNAS